VAKRDVVSEMSDVKAVHGVEQELLAKAEGLAAEGNKEEARKVVDVLKSYIDTPRRLAAQALDPARNAASTVATVINQKQEASYLKSELEQYIKAVNSGDMSRPEAMLVSQACTLDGMFNALVRLAYLNHEACGMDIFERMIRLAYKAQIQCTRTLEVLGSVKYPANVSFVKQANIANQQIVTNEAPRAGTVESLNRELSLEQLNEQLLESGSAPAAGRSHSSMEAVGKVNGPKDSRRKA
jgi:hypothetical protein